MFITISAMKKKLTVLLLVVALIIMGFWGAPRVLQPADKDQRTVTTVGEKGAPPLLERVINRLRVYYQYR